MTGLRSHSDGTSEHRPMPRPSAHIHEVICAGVAWKACAAWNTMATELVNPTNTATKPAVKADRLRSLKIAWAVSGDSCMRQGCPAQRLQARNCYLNNSL